MYCPHNGIFKKNNLNDESQGNNTMVFATCPIKLCFQSCILIHWIKIASHFTYKGCPEKFKVVLLRTQVNIGTKTE